MDPAQHPHPRAHLPHAGHRAAAVHSGLLAQGHRVPDLSRGQRLGRDRRLAGAALNMVSELGQLLDPIADKLLLFATLIPIFWLTRHPTILVDYRIPWWGSLPVWVALLLAGAILLTVYSLVVYLYRYRALLKGRG